MEEDYENEFLENVFTKMKLEEEKEDEQIIFEILEEDMIQLVQMYKILVQDRNYVLYFHLNDHPILDWKNGLKTKLRAKICLEEFRFYFEFHIRSSFCNYELETESNFESNFENEIENDIVEELVSLYCEYYDNLFF